MSVITHTATFIFGVVLGIIFGLGGLSGPAIKEMQAKAVELGAATWQVDQKTGETKFVWNEGKEKP